MSRSPIVIVGAGIMGASVAWHLATRGRRDVLVLDRSRKPGAGSTGAATGGFRAQFETPIHVQLSLLAREALRRFPEQVGADPGYEPHGYLWLASREEELAALRGAHAVQHAHGLTEATLVTPEEAARLNPQLELAGIVGAAFCPSDGFLRPLQILDGYLEAARRLGVRFEWDREVLGVERGDDGAIAALRTASGAIACEAVVNAAGAWAGALAALAGVELPVTPLRRQVATTVPTAAVPAAMPMSIFLEDGFHLRVREGRVLLLQPDVPPAGDPFACDVDPDWLDRVEHRAHVRVPALRDVPLDRARCWAGLYEMSPDRHALLGPAPGCPNLFLINGSSGHGVMHAPALGLLLAEILLDGAASTLDVRALRPSRFAEGEPNPVSALL